MDWAEHAVTLFGLAGGLCVVLAGMVWRSLVRSVEKVAAAVERLGEKFDTISTHWAERMHRAEERLSAVEGICHERHGVGRRAVDHALVERLLELEKSCQAKDHE